MEIIEEGPKPARAWSLAIKTWHSRFWLARRIAALPEVEVVRMPNGRSFFTGKAFMEFDYKGVRYLAYKDKVSDEDFEIHPGKMGYHPETSELCWALHRAVNG